MGLDLKSLYPKYRHMYPDVKSAMWSLYPQAQKRMQDACEVCVDFYVYKADIHDTSKLITNGKAIEDELTDDAHISGIQLVSHSVKLVKTQWLRIHQGALTVGRLHRSYNDPKLELCLKSSTEQMQTVKIY